MKKLLGIAIAGLIVWAPSAMAGDAAGCGLGSVIFEGKDGLVFNVLAATTNGISGNNTFGMTSGTSGCDADAVVLEEHEQEVYVSAIMDNLSQDMAMGGGQYLQSMAVLMGCSTDVQGNFATLAQDRYEVLLPTLDTTATDLIGGLKRELAADPVLSASCSRIS